MCTKIQDRSHFRKACTAYMVGDHLPLGKGSRSEPLPFAFAGDKMSSFSTAKLAPSYHSRHLYLDPFRFPREH